MIRGGAFFRLLLFATVTSAVPFQRLEREVRSAPANNSQISEECISDDVVYHSGDQVPSPGPCEQCFCDPPNVICTMVKCKLNSGCKTIQRANHCCPDYKCDCEYNGKVYNNGERLDRPDDPCQVCYCKGGEVMCTSITCYEREDCKPHYVDGQCCPKYDHCPIESVRFSGNSIRSVNSTSSKREMQPWLLTKEVSVQPSQMSQTETTSKATELQTESSSVQKYPLTIKIREILPTASHVRELVSSKLSTSHKSVVSGIPIIKLPATTVSHTTERNMEEVSTTHQSIPVIKLSTLSKENSLPVTLEETYSIDLTTESVLGLKSKIESFKSPSNMNGKTDNIHDRIESEESTENIPESKLDGENIQDKSHNNYQTKLDSLKVDSLKEALTDGIMNTKSQTDINNQFTTVGNTDSEENGSKQHSEHSSERSSEQSSETSSKFTSDQSSAHSSDESNEFNSEESSTVSHPSFDLIVDIHNSPGKTKFTLPTVESFSTMYPNKYDLDSDITESSFPKSSSTEILTGGVYEDTSSEMSYSSETESASEIVVTEQSEQNSNVISESVPTETTTLVTEGENSSTASTESYRMSSYLTDSPPVSSFSEDVMSTRPTLILSQSEEDLNSPGRISTESEEKKPNTYGHSSESSSSSDSSSSEENEGSEENNHRRDELPPILQLNEQIQYLKLGGHHEDDTSGEQIQPLIHVDIFNIHSKAASCNSSSISDNNSGDKNHSQNSGIKITENIKTSGGDVKVSHILLSPNDLKVLAEMLINEQGKHSSSDKNNNPKVKNINDKDMFSTSPKDIDEEAVTGTSKHFIVTTELNELDISSNNSSENNSSGSDESVLNSSDEIKMNHSSLQLQLPEEKEPGNDLITTTSAAMDDIEVVTQLNKDEVNTNHNTNSSEINDSEEFSPSDSSEVNLSSSEGMTEGSFDVEEVTKKHQRKDVDTEFSNNSKPEKYRNKKSKDIHSLQDSNSDDNVRMKSVTQNYETSTNDEQESLKDVTAITNFMTPKDMDDNSESHTVSRETTIPDTDYLIQQTPSAIEEQQLSISKNVLKKNISPP